jgi:hypothetical protein
LSATPADAATWSSRSLGHTPFTCSDKSLWIYRSTQVGATIYAAARDRCGHFALVSGSPTAGYHIEKTPFAGYGGTADNVDGIARDGATTYFVRLNPRYAGHLELWQRTSAGKYVQIRTLTSAARFSTYSRFPAAFVAAAGGHWTAAWSQVNSYGLATAYAESTLPGHSGHTERISAVSNAVSDQPTGIAVLSSTRVELVLVKVSAKAITIYARRSTSTGWSAGRTLTTASGPNGNAGVGMSLVGLAQRSGVTYAFIYRQTASSSDLELVTDNWTQTRRALITTTAASFDARMAVDQVSGHIWFITERGTNHDRIDLYTNATGAWRSRQLSFGSDIGLDALTAYSSNVAVYYSPAGTPQDTVYYSH